MHSSHTLRNVHNIPTFNVKHIFLKNSFLPSTVSEWNKLDPGIRNSESLSLFNKNILHLIRPALKSIYNCHNPKGVKLITPLRLGLSHSTRLISKIRLIPYAVVVMILKLQLIFFSTVPYF